MTACIMVTTPTKGLAAAREKLAPPERTIATELPQELCRISEHCGFSAANSYLKGVKSAAHGGDPEKTGRPKKAATDPKTRQRAVLTATAFTDDGHPTILAAPRG